MITLKTEKGNHIVTVNGEKHSFGKFRDALKFIFDARKLGKEKRNENG